MSSKRMTGAGREWDILSFLHRNYLVNEQWVTMGEYARFAGITRSPYLRSVFNALIDEGYLTMQQEPYRATVKYTFALDYAKIEACHQPTKTALIESMGSWPEVSS